jgi:para-nitrobenzyl esterase
VNVRVKTTKGIVEGVECGTYTLYKGIPYAKPPIGELRWKAPREMDTWEGIFKADHFAPITVQRMPTADNVITGRFLKEFYNDPEYLREMSEDCLYLNIWAPNNARDKKFPVAFWIHGGGFGGGYSSEIEFDGEAYCKNGVILVTVEYRCGAFGFLAHPWLSEENELGISGNYGILDQIEALKWVYQNIESFGGDPSNITIFGQSAGSMSTQVLVSSELTADMPAKAIMQSGLTCEDNFLLTPTLREEEEFGKEFVEITGASNIEELRNLSTEQIMEAKDKFDGKMWGTGKGIVMVPNVDGYVLKNTVGDVWKQGEMKKIPYMLGCVIDDLGSTPEIIKEKKPGKLMEESIRWSHRMEELTGNPAYTYFFTRELPGDDWGAFHSCELWYMFGTLNRCWRPMTKEDEKLSDEMITYWTNFMKTGKPASENTKEWEPCSKDNPHIRYFE